VSVSVTSCRHGLVLETIVAGKSDILRFFAADGRVFCSLVSAISARVNGVIESRTVQAAPVNRAGCTLV